MYQKNSNSKRVKFEKKFLENMGLAFDKSAVVKEYKEEISILEKNSNTLAKKVGTLIIGVSF